MTWIPTDTTGKAQAMPEIDRAMDESNPDAPPRMIRLRMEQVPFEGDPPDAVHIYAALGRMLVQWGRLEAIFNSVLLNILRMPEAAFLIGRSLTAPLLPRPLEQRRNLWTRAFRDMPLLNVYGMHAGIVDSRLADLGDERNLLIHAFWQNFSEQDGAVSLGFINFRGRDATSVSLEYGAAGVTEIDDLTSRIFAVNEPLAIIVRYLESVSPPPSGAALVWPAV